MTDSKDSEDAANIMTEKQIGPVRAVSEEVTRIASQAKETFERKGCRWDTYFYKVVLAGNVKITKQVVDHMANQGSTEALDWLFKRKHFEERHHVLQKRSKRLLFVRVLLFVLMSLLTITMTPIFYTLHMLSTSLLNRKKRRISANIRLPLAYAAFSQSKEMVMFFLSQGVELEHIDNHGNNLFHYISDLSSVAADTAIQIFCSMVTEINDRDSVKQLLERDRNSAGLTAVEYAAKFGSPSLLTQILKQPDIMHHTPFSAGVGHVMFREEDGSPGQDARAAPDDDDEQETQANEQHDASTRVELVDVSKYEAGNLADQSTPLNILSDRDVAAMSRAGLQIFSDTRFIGKWLILKCKQMIAGVLFFQLLDFIITCLLVILLGTAFTGENGAAFRAWRGNEDQKVQLAEVKEWAHNRSTIFTDEYFHSYINTKHIDLQRELWGELWMDDPESILYLLNVTSLDHILPDDSPMQEWDIIFYSLNTTQLNTMSAHALTMPQFANYTPRIRAYRLFPKLFQAIGKGVHNQDVQLTKYTYRAMYKNLTIEDDGNIVNVGLDALLPDTCQILGPENPKQFKVAAPKSIKFADFQRFAFDSCYYQVFVNIAGKCNNNDKRLLLEKMFSFAPEAMVVRYIILFAVSCTYLYIILDIVERSVFLTNSVVYQTSARDIIITALGQKVPGSYMRKQLNVLSAIIIIVYFHFQKYVTSQSFLQRSSYVDYMSFELFVTKIFIVAIVVRFLMHIHSLRLLPGIGHFVITTFMMGTNLMHFSAVFGIVLLIFSVLFHILIDDPSCPLEKAEGFVTLQDSLLSTFKLTFGHGNLDPFFSSAPVQLTYVLYIIIVGLLLLNLIIAIMSTTATDIMAEPWREVLWKVEWLDEATSVEYTFSVISLPFRKLTGFGYFFHKKAGYMVTRMPNKKYKIYIECFHCPALHVQEEE